ncbi:MAG: cytidine/deoxycytidylate deaminase family protein [Candidatus Magasanikbacteria bacterium]|nr:cytidine/deoxycytidylate deaminase family protein [Candidatus Magasanikbacteria bacterium]
MSDTTATSPEAPFKRPTWDEYFMEIAETVAHRATCDRGKCGSVIVRDKVILATGYVGSAAGMPHCDEVGHQMKTMTHEDGTQSHHCVRTTHAEQNAIVQAARKGTAIEGATIYTKMTPCSACGRMIVNAGIKRVVCNKRYHAGGETEAMFLQLGIEMLYLDGSLEQYKNQ